MHHSSVGVHFNGLDYRGEAWYFLKQSVLNLQIVFKGLKLVYMILSLKSFVLIRTQILLLSFPIEDMVLKLYLVICSPKINILLSSYQIGIKHKVAGCKHRY